MRTTFVGGAKEARTRHLVSGLLLALLVLWPWSRAFATHDLMFVGEDYSVRMVIGGDGSGRAAIANVYFSAPGVRGDVLLPLEHWQVDAFDTWQRVLHLRHTHYSGYVPPFTLTVDGEVAVLEIAGQRIRLRSGWQDM